MTLQSFKDRLTAIMEFIYFDRNEYLREKTSNPLELKILIAYGESLLQSIETEDEFYYLKGNIGNLYRIIGEGNRAIGYLKEALEFAKGNKAKEIITLIRLGEALKVNQQHQEALELFEKALHQCFQYKITTYIDFVLQHKGKCLLELNQVEAASICFHQALHYREIKGDLALIESTKIAIHYCEKMIDS